MLLISRTSSSPNTLSDAGDAAYNFEIRTWPSKKNHVLHKNTIKDNCPTDKIFHKYAYP